MIKIIDNALSKRAYNDLLAQIACGPFRDESNSVDGVVYPMICKNVPESVSGEIYGLMPAECNVEFLRSSPEGVYCPNPVHHDYSMGRLSLMLYTSTIGGTGIMRHKKTGICTAPDCSEFVDIVAQDSANIDAWEILEIAEAKPNRLAIFDARLMHAALPFGGAGKGLGARTVYTRFAG